MAIDKKILLPLILIPTLLAAFFIGLYSWVDLYHPFGWEPYMFKQWVTKVFYYPVKSLIKDTIFTYAFIGVLGFTLLMERLFPAKKNQKIFSQSFFQDMVWFFYEAMMHAFIISTYVILLKQGYSKYFGFLTIIDANNLPAWGRFALGFLVVDFLFWLQHWMNHKIPFLWKFHEVHHSQEEINFFTDYRYHVVEYMTRQTVLVIPFLIFTVDVPEIVLFSFFRSWYTRFYHGNIRTNLGFLRYILVTPQSHRVHHSREQEHYDMNFGALFSIWDFLFRTQCMDFRTYPETGIPDKNFPLEKKSSPLRILITPLIQLKYPFQKIFGKK